MPGGSTTGAPDWRDAAKLRKFLADDIPQWTPSEGAENTRAFLAALREKCSTEIGAMTGLLLALFEERVDASKAGFELAQKLKRGGGGATPREELDMEMLFGDTEDFESAASAEVKIEQVDWTPELEAKWRAQVKGVLKLITHMVVSNTNPKIRDSLSVERCGGGTHLLCFSRIRSRMLSMQRATPWFVGPAIHGARAAQLLSRSRAHSRERARRAHTSAQQIDAQRSRLIAHSLSRSECRLPLMANRLAGGG